MTADAPPTYSVRELNTAIGSLLERGFAPRFLVQATASRPQVKKGHLWITLTDGEASITAVAWASKLKQLDLRHNALTGPIPPELSNLPKLRTLFLYGNNFTGCLPAGLRDVETNDFTTLGSLSFCGD